MTRDADFERFAADATTGMILTLRKMGGATFTEADRRAIEEGLDVIRVACVQPVGMSASFRVPGAVSSEEYERAKMMVVMGAMQLWASGKLDLVEVDTEFVKEEA